MSKLLTLSLAAMLFVLNGCGSKETGSANTGNPTNANKTTVVIDPPANTNVAPNKPAETATPKTVAENSSEKIGVPECDEYLAKVESCVFTKVPEASRAMFKPSLDQTRKSWKDLAANPQTKASLASACKTALDSAKQTYASFSCEF